MPRPTTATIHSSALRHNLALLRAEATGSKVMAMVKADGYGHGLERVVRALADVDAFGVASLDDAAGVRQTGLLQPIAVMAGIDAPQDVSRVQQLGVEPVIYHFAQIEMLEQQLARQSATHAPVGSAWGLQRCWLKIDSGMHRLGFPPEDARQAHARLTALGCEVGLMTHFASSDEFRTDEFGTGEVEEASERGRQTRDQLTVFERCTEGLPGPRSLANSAAVLGWPQAHADWIRPGGALYGMSVVAGRSGVDFGLRPAMTFSTRLLAVNRIAAGEHIGYSATWQAPEDMPVGVAAVGYGDGYPRQMPAGSPVLVNGRVASVVGRVSMDLMTIDLRQHPEAKPGDPVILWGEGLPVDIVAAAAGTIGYALTCGITRRVCIVED